MSGMVDAEVGDQLAAAMVRRVGWKSVQGAASCPLHAPVPPGQPCWESAGHGPHDIYGVAPVGSDGPQFVLQPCPGRPE